MIRGSVLVTSNCFFFLFLSWSVSILVSGSVSLPATHIRITNENIKDLPE